MKFFVDNQRPLQVARFLEAEGHHAVHAAEVGMDEAQDMDVWNWASQNGYVVVSKDEDFLFLAKRPRDLGRLVWIRLGNCRKAPLVEAMRKNLASIVESLEADQRIIELA